MEHGGTNRVPRGPVLRGSRFRAFGGGDAGPVAASILGSHAWGPTASRSRLRCRFHAGPAGAGPRAEGSAARAPLRLRPRSVPVRGGTGGGLLRGPASPRARPRRGDLGALHRTDHHRDGRRGGHLRAAVEMERRWAHSHHFELYDDVVPALASVRAHGLSIGLLSNSSRNLTDFVSHHGLDADAVLTSFAHGKTKPHESIFLALLALLGVSPEQAAMVGDTVPDDIEGARAVGMRAVLIDREGRHPESGMLCPICGGFRRPSDSNSLARCVAPMSSGPSSGTPRIARGIGRAPHGSAAQSAAPRWERRSTSCPTGSAPTRSISIMRSRSGSS